MVALLRSPAHLNMQRTRDNVRDEKVAYRHSPRRAAGQQCPIPAPEDGKKDRLYVEPTIALCLEGEKAVAVCVEIESPQAHHDVVEVVLRFEEETSGGVKGEHPPVVG